MNDNKVRPELSDAKTLGIPEQLFTTFNDLKDLGVTFVIDTCVVVTPILPNKPGTLMTNSAKFAHYTAGNTGYAPVFGSLTDCVKSAQSGKLTWDNLVWG